MVVPASPIVLIVPGQPYSPAMQRADCDVNGSPLMICTRELAPSDACKSTLDYGQDKLCCIRNQAWYFYVLVVERIVLCIISTTRRMSKYMCVYFVYCKVMK